MQPHGAGRHDANAGVEPHDADDHELPVRQLRERAAFVGGDDEILHPRPFRISKALDLVLIEPRGDAEAKQGGHAHHQQNDRRRAEQFKNDGIGEIFFHVSSPSQGR